MRSRGLYYVTGAGVGFLLAWFSGLSDTSTLTIAGFVGLGCLKMAEHAEWVAPAEKPFRPTILFHRDKHLQTAPSRHDLPPRPTRRVVLRCFPGTLPVASWNTRRNVWTETARMALRKRRRTWR